MELKVLHTQQSVALDCEQVKNVTKIAFCVSSGISFSIVDPTLLSSSTCKLDPAQHGQA